MAPNEKVCVDEKLGLRSKHRVKLNLLIVEIVFSQKVWKKDDQCTSIFHFADRPELPYEVDFSRNRFPTKIGFQKMCRFLYLRGAFLEGGFERFRRYFDEFVGIVARNPDEK